MWRAVIVHPSRSDAHAPGQWRASAEGEAQHGDHEGDEEPGRGGRSVAPRAGAGGVGTRVPTTSFLYKNYKSR